MPDWRIASIEFSGMPQSPKPPDKIVRLSSKSERSLNNLMDEFEDKEYNLDKLIKKIN